MRTFCTPISESHPNCVRFLRTKRTDRTKQGGVAGPHEPCGYLIPEDLYVQVGTG